VYIIVVESIVPYSPLSCVSDHPIVPSPCLPPRTPDCFALPSVGHSSSIKSPKSVNEAVFSAPSASRSASPKLQKAVSTSTIVQPPSQSNVDVNCISPMPSLQEASCTDDLVAGDDSANKKLTLDHNRSVVSIPSDLLPFSMTNVFSSEEQKKQVIDDVST